MNILFLVGNNNYIFPFSLLKEINDYSLNYLYLHYPMGSIPIYIQDNVFPLAAITLYIRNGRDENN
jgi:hypothetical protein